MTVPDSSLLDDLTEAQQSAVTHGDGALLVLAGPGSGKTTVVTRRIAQLISGGVEPWRILALTFTNKAAGEMRDRVFSLLPEELIADGAPTVATFHSFCARLLRRFAAHAGLAPHYSIYDSDDQRDAVKRGIADAGLSSKNWTPAAIAAEISNAKNRLELAADYAARAQDFYTKSIARVYTNYEKILRANDALDFDDLLLSMARLLKDNEDVRTRLQRRYRYLLIDEYQDTNHAQFVIAHVLAAAHGNICVVGDPDQSIYGWRGADLSNILEFEEHHPDAVIVPLGQNFRSTGHIVAAADGLIRNNRRRKHKTLFTELDDGDKPTAVVCRDEHHEAMLVADYLRAQSEEHDVPWKDMAVLYRVNALSRVLEERLRHAEIPYVIARGTAFYERKEVRDALAYLRLVVNPNDEVSLRRIVNTPTRGIGKTSLDKIELTAVDRQMRLDEGLRLAATGGVDGLSARAVKAVDRFVAMIDGFRQAASGAGSLLASLGLAELVERVIRDSGLEAMYHGQTDEDRQRVENLNELVSAASQFIPVRPADGNDEDDDGSDEPMTTLQQLSAFLESVALVSDADMIDPERGSVTLMTLHAAKGLEFEAVALVGLEESLLPHLRATESDIEVEEERRLCFVGMTRAKRRLMLTRASVRTHRGMRNATIESRFLGELPRDVIVYSDQSDFVDVEDIHGTPIDYDPGELEVSEFPVGSVVRHPKFGLGRVLSIMRRARGSSARVDFPSAGVKTLILEHAHLERVG